MEITDAVHEKKQGNASVNGAIKKNPFYKNTIYAKHKKQLGIAEKIETIHAEFDQPLSFWQNINAYRFMALDIDTDKIRYIIGKSNGKSINVSDYGGHILPVREHDSEKALYLTLANIKANHYKNGLRVHVSFYSPDITLRQIELPKLRKEKDVENALNLKLQTELAGFNDDTLWRFEHIGSFTKDEQEYARYLVVIVPGQIVERYMNALLHTGLKPDTLIPRPIALYNIYKRMMPDPANDIIVDISYELTHIIALRQSQIAFTRTITSGATNLESAVHKKKAVLLQPETFKVGDDPGIGREGAIKAEAIRKVLKNRLRAINAQQIPVLQLYKNEIQSSLGFLNTLINNAKNIRIFLTGYGIQKENLIGYLRNQLNVGVNLLSPRLGSDSLSAYGEYSAVIGAVTNGKTPYNVVPEEFKSNAFFKQLNLVASLIGMFSLVLISWETYTTYQTISRVDAEIQKVERKYRKINPVQIEYVNLRKKIKNTEKQRRQLTQSLLPGSPVTDIMKLLSNETPEQIVLTEVEVHPDYGKTPERKKRKKKKSTSSKKKSKKQTIKHIVKISGYVNGDYLMSDVILINYVDRLKKIGFFKNIDVNDKVKRSKKKQLTFDLKAEF